MNGILTLKEAAGSLKVHPETVKKWIIAGKLKGYKLGNLYRIRREDFDEFLKLRMVK